MNGILRYLYAQKHLFHKEKTTLQTKKYPPYDPHLSVQQAHFLFLLFGWRHYEVLRAAKGHWFDGHVHKLPFVVFV